jgi:hypothetical protein
MSEQPTVADYILPTARTPMCGRAFGKTMNQNHGRCAPTGAATDEEHTTAAVQRHLDELAGDSPSESVIRALLNRVVCPLHKLCDP